MKSKAIPVLSTLLAAQLVLALALQWRSDLLAPARPTSVLVAADLDAVDHLRIEGPVAPDLPASGAAGDPQLELVKRDGHWTMPAHFGAPADASKVEALLRQLHTLRRGLPIATTKSAAERFAVADHHFERRVVASAGDKALATVYLGNSPGPRQSDARVDGEAPVYAVELASYDLPTRADSWLDDALLDQDVAAPVAIELRKPGQPALALERSGTSWKATGIAPDQRVDAAKAQALADAIAHLKVDALLGENPKPEWHQDKPELVLAMKDDKGKSVTWTLSKPASGSELVLKSSDKPWYLQLEPMNAHPLLDAAASDKLIVAAAAPAQAATPVAAASAALATQHAQR